MSTTDILLGSRLFLPNAARLLPEPPCDGNSPLPKFLLRFLGGVTRFLSGFIRNAARLPPEPPRDGNPPLPKSPLRSSGGATRFLSELICDGIHLLPEFFLGFLQQIEIEASLENKATNDKVN